MCVGGVCVGVCVWGVCVCVNSECESYSYNQHCWWSQGFLFQWLMTEHAAMMQLSSGYQSTACVQLCNTKILCNSTLLFKKFHTVVLKQTWQVFICSSMRAALSPAGFSFSSRPLLSWTNFLKPSYFLSNSCTLSNSSAISSARAVAWFFNHSHWVYIQISKALPYTWKFSPGENFCQFRLWVLLAKFFSANIFTRCRALCLDQSTHYFLEGSSRAWRNFCHNTKYEPLAKFLASENFHIIYMYICMIIYI